MNMFCYQCQEASRGAGCTLRGTCGKTDDTARMQDLLMYALKGIALVNAEARKAGINDEETDSFVIEGLFSTITNVNFDKNYFVEKVKEALALRESIKAQLQRINVNVEDLHDSVKWYADSEEEFDRKAQQVGILSTENEDIRSLQSLVTFGVKGMAAYAYHAANLGYKDPDISKFIEKALIATLDDSMTVNDYVSLTMETGKYGVDVMALLDKANTATYGNPEITRVNIGVRKNLVYL